MTKEPSKEAKNMDIDNVSADVPSENETEVNMEDSTVTENGANMETDTNVSWRCTILLLRYSGY